MVKAVDWLMEANEEEILLMGKKATATVKRLNPETIYNEMISFYDTVIKEFGMKE